MAEGRHFSRLVKVLTGIVFTTLLLWLWLDHAFRAPDIVPVLLQSAPALEAAPIEKLLANDNPSKDFPTTGSSGKKPDETVIDCSSPESAKQQVEALVEQSFGAELTELVLSGALTWTEQHPSTIKPDWQVSGGVAVPATYQSYTDDMLKLAADNGDATAAAIFGARSVHNAFTERHSLENTLPNQLTVAERYLQQGIQGNVDGTLQFFWTAAEKRAAHGRKTVEGSDRAQYTDRAAVIELHARTMAIQIYGTFEERAMAHLLLYVLADELAPLQDDKEKLLAHNRARQLQQQFAHINTERSPEERRAENAIVATAKKAGSIKATFKALHCHDGQELDQVLPEDTLDAIQERYKL